MNSYTDSTGTVVEMDAAYDQQRTRAERIAAGIAANCVIEYAKNGGRGRRATPGQRFLALGGCDKDGPWHFVLDYASAEDRADVDAYLAATA